MDRPDEARPSADLGGGAGRVMARCRALGRLSDRPDGLFRPFLSPATREAHALVAGWMREAGLDVRVDALGNLRGRRAGPAPGAPTFLIGSHLDTVPNAGMYDGVLGVTLALEVAEGLRDAPLPYALEVIAFSEEEGVRFGTPFLGSRAVAGSLDPAWLDAWTDADGVTPRRAILDFGLDPDAWPDARARGLLAFLEVHIEQGPVLAALGAPIGVVGAINGQTRASVVFSGQASHAGTTPMHARRDALTGAATFALRAETLGQTTPDLTATVGRLEVEPGAANVVPGAARLTLDVRHPDDAARRAALAALERDAHAIAEGRGLAVAFDVTHDQPAVPLDAARLARLAPDLPALPSGAGHDAMILAAASPAAMIFVRSPNGLSHHPDETVDEADVAAALALALAYALDLAAVPASDPAPAAAPGRAPSGAH